jgi:dolichol-phosphate mannosyltransferase
VLSRAVQDYEILVIVSKEVAEANQNEGAGSARVRWLASEGAGGYGEALRLGFTAGRFSLVAVAHISIDTGNLDYLVPLAVRYPVVCGYRANRPESIAGRVCSWSYNALSRSLLGTGVRDCASGLVVVWKSALADVLPESEGPFASAEMLARARVQGFAVAEVPVSLAVPACPESGPSWRRLPGKFLSFMSFWWSRGLFPGRSPLPPQKGSWVFGCLLMLLAALVLFPELDQPLLDPDEGRQAEIPREMLAHDDFLTPRMMGLPYYEKPPLQYWLTAAAYTVFGVKPWVARFVPAFAAWLTVLLTFVWGRKALGARPAFLGGLGLCLSLGFIMLGRPVVLDSLLTACVVASWYAGHTAVAGPVFRWRWWVASGLACGLGVLAKGPVALVLLVVPIVAFQVLSGDTIRLRWRHWGIYLMLGAAVAGPWYLTMAVTAPGYLKAFIWKANVVRFVEPYDHQNPWWYYFPLLFVATLPWSFLWAWLGYFLFSKSRRIVMLRRPGLGFCLLSVLWCLIFFSVSGCKSPLYPASALAPLALMHGVCLDAILFRRVGHKDRFLGYARQTLPRRATLVMLILSAVGSLVIGILRWETWPIVVLELGLSLAAVLAWSYYGRLASPRFAWGVCALATLVMVVVSARDLLTGFASRHSINTIAKVARRWSGCHNCFVISYGRQWPSASFYLQRDCIGFVEKDQCQQLVNFLKTQPEAMVLVESGPPLKALLAALPPSLKAQVILPEREGQGACVVVRQCRPMSLAQHK